MTGAGNEALIVAQGGAADFGAVSILTAQTLLGGGGTIQLRGLNTGRLAEYTAPGTRPTIATNGIGIFAQSLFRVSNVTLDGQGGGAAAIHLHAAATITDVSMTDFSVGLLLDRPFTYTIRDSTLSGSNSAMAVSQSANVVLDDSTIQNSGTGILMDGLFGASTIAVNNTVFTGNFTGYLFDFQSAAHNIAASASNTNTSVSSGVCVLTVGGSFAGTIGIGGANVVAADCD
jgi:hypothetical protein